MKHHLTFLGVVILAAVAIWFSLSPQYPAALGLDLRGGTRVTLSPDYSKLDGKKVDAESMQLVRSVLETRVNSFGLSGADVRLKGKDQVLVLLPGARNPEEALKTLSTTALMEFRYLDDVQSDRNLNPTYRMEFTAGDARKGETDTYRFTEVATNKPVDVSEVLKNSELILKGDALKPTSKPDVNPNNGQPYVSFQMDGEGAKVFGQFTTDHVGEVLAIVLDGQIISAPRIDEPITGGEGTISGGFNTILEAKVLATLLNSGALPIPLIPIETQTVGATLGQASIEKSIQAGIAGLGIVLLFMLCYYWLPGVVACLALVVYAALNFALFKGAGIFPAIVLDLPGITGFILSIGMAVDGNVLIFERLKEELRGGKPLNAAIDSGFKRAFTAIIDSNVTVWIICVILVWLGSPVVKGFAVTLAIGNAVAMFTAISVTRAFLQVLTGFSWARNLKLYGMNNSWLNLFFPSWRNGGIMRIWDRRRIYLGISGFFAAVSVVLIALTPFNRGLKPGIDFTGGSVIETAFRDANVTREQVDSLLEKNGVRDATIRMGWSEQPWSRVTIEASEMDATTAANLRARLEKYEGLTGFEPGLFKAGTPGKNYRTEAVYTTSLTEGQVRAALADSSGDQRAVTASGLKILVAPLPRIGSDRVATAEIITRQLPPTRLDALRTELRSIGSGTVESLTRVNSIGPSIAAEVTRNGITSGVIASLAMLLFLAFRFAIGGFGNGLKFGTGAVVALFHDVLITVGCFALMGQLANWQVDSLFLTACLGLLGFSVNDTIVIYDRVRENLGRRRKGESFAEVSDRSMTESFDRSFNTSFAIMLALAAMVAFGGETLRLFNFALLFGMAIGTYSSVFVATPVVVLLEQAAASRETRRAVASVNEDPEPPISSEETITQPSNEAIPDSDGQHRNSSTRVKPRPGRRM